MFILMITGAAIFLCGVFLGLTAAEHSRPGEQDKYKAVYIREYGKTNGLYEPVKRGGYRE